MTLLSKAWLNFLAPIYQTHETSNSENIVAETNTNPPETGVYVAATDPNEAPQFSWLVVSMENSYLVGHLIS
jgi:hypothetical protein